jgi:channel protein (hemolysin III family)
VWAPHVGRIPGDRTASDLLAIPGFAEPFSSLSHLVAGALFGVQAVPLMRRGVRSADAARRWRQTGRVLSLAIFAASAVLLLAMSGAFHLLGRGGAARHVFQRLDHAAIFILIAGTFTPIPRHPVQRPSTMGHARDDLDDRRPWHDFQVHLL